MIVIWGARRRDVTVGSPEDTPAAGAAAPASVRVTLVLDLTAFTAALRNAGEVTMRFAAQYQRQSRLQRGRVAERRRRRQAVARYGIGHVPDAVLSDRVLGVSPWAGCGE